MPRIVVTGRDDKVTSRHKNHAEEKISKLEKYFDGIVKIEAVLGHDRDGAAAELVISVRRGKPLVSNAHAQELYAAIDVVLDKAEKQLTRHKEKLKGRKGEPKSVPSEDLGPGAVEDSEEERYQDIVDQRDFSQVEKPE